MLLLRPLGKEHREIMIRSAASKVMWVGRATVFFVGLAVIVGLVFGVASVAFGKDGDFFILGALNPAESTSTLDKSGAGPALDLQVDRRPALAVSTRARVNKLNADQLDGKDSTQFAPAGATPIWAIVDIGGTLLSSSPGVTGSSRIGEGAFRVTFDRDVRSCAHSATLYAFNGEINVVRLSSLFPNPDTPQSITVNTRTSSGDPADVGFHLITFC